MREVTWIGGPSDGGIFAVPDDMHTLVIAESPPVSTYITCRLHDPRPVPVTKWHIPIREDNTAHWADRKEW